MRGAVWENFYDGRICGDYGLFFDENAPLCRAVQIF